MLNPPSLQRPFLAAAMVLSVGACAAPDDAEDLDPEAVSSDELRACKAGKDIDWKLHMKEDFDEWNDARFTKFDDHVPPGTSTCYLASNVTVRDGMLRIATKKESVCQGQPHTGGAIESYGKFWTGKYFKAAVRAKVSQEKGIFSAPLWFRPGTAQGAGAVGGEIDVVEVLGKGWRNKYEPALIHTTLHSDYSLGAQITQKAKFEKLGDADGTDFHVYTVEKTPRGLTFYVDGKHVAGWGCGSRDNDKRPAWFNDWFEDTPEGWSIRIDNKVGGNWAGEPDATTRWGNKTALYVDYIKVWRPAK